MVSDAMKQLEERHLANKVDLVVWSNKMDLLALSNSKGEVCLHRLNWQRAWILPPPNEDDKVIGIAWRPDGKVIAVAYSIGQAFLINVENKEVFHRIKYNSQDKITYITWIEDKHPNLKTDAKYFQEAANLFLPKLPATTNNVGSISEHEPREDLEDLKLVTDQTSLNFLLIGVSSGFLGLNVFGIVPCGNLYLPDQMRSRGKIVSADISLDLKYIFVIVDIDGCLKVVTFDSTILYDRSRELFNISYKYCMFISLIDYLKGIMDNISEYYENMLLLEMEAKWAKYSEEYPTCSLSSDFLELLLFGVMSVELEKFLTKDLTEKGIQKLGNSIEISHCSIQKLILTHLSAVCSNIIFHLSDFRAMARLTDRYQILGIEEEAVSKTFREVSAFMLKADEVQLVIDSSLKKYKAFFKWITGVLSRLGDDKMSDNPSTVPELSLQETNLIAEYLYLLDVKSEGNAYKQYWLDKVGEYLLDKNLSETFELCDSNYWSKIVNSNNCLLNNSRIIVRDEKLSLVQQMNKLMGVMCEMIKGMRDAVGQQSSVIYDCEIGPSAFGSISTFPSVTNTLTIAFNSNNKFYLTQIIPGQTPDSYTNINKTQTSFTYDSLNLKVIDLQFYVENVVSLLLEECNDGRSAVFLQLPLSVIRTNGCIDTSKDLESAGRKIDNMVGGKLAVSGTRKVAVIVSENRHKVRTYETEVEDDEDEEEMDLMSNHHSSTNTSLDQSID